MNENAEKISKKSIWNITTPPPLALSLPFFCYEAGFFYADNDYLVERDYHDSYLLIYCVSGLGEIITGDIIAELSSGQAILLDCHIKHSYRTIANNWNFMWLHFNGASARVFYNIIAGAICKPITPSLESNFSEAFMALIEKVHLSDTLGLMLISRQIENLLVTLTASTVKSEKSIGNQDMDLTIKKAVEYLRAHYNESISIDDLCHNLSVSKYHFIRSFHHIMGIPPYSFLQNYRVTMAKRLLITTQDSVENIAFATGFKDSANFIACFKAHVGQTPLKYRKDHFEIL